MGDVSWIQIFFLAEASFEIMLFIREWQITRRVLGALVPGWMKRSRNHGKDPADHSEKRKKNPEREGSAEADRKIAPKN